MGEFREGAVTAENFSAWYGEKQVLYDITANFPINQTTALIGPSGCGKSTFLRSFNRMNDLVSSFRMSGTAKVFSQDIYQDLQDLVLLRRDVGMVFQKSNPFPKSIFDNIAFGPKLGGVKDYNQLSEIVEDSLVKADLWEEVKDRLNQSALALSGGQQQRLCIARALAVKPKILLMDEPASALDPRSTGKIEELIFRLKSSITIIIVTHNMQQAARVSDFTAFFLEGRLVEYDKTGKIFTNPAVKDTEDYITGRFG